MKAARGRCWGNCMEKVIVEFIAKKEHQKRKEYKFETWFALSNSIMENPDYCHLNPLEFKALIYIYCQCSKNKWRQTAINFHHALKLFDIERECLSKVIDLLEKNKKIKIIDDAHEPIQAAIGESSGSDQAAIRQLQTEKEEKQTNKQTNTRAPIPTVKNDFEIADGLNGYEPLDQVLCTISTKLQNQWLARYKNSEWVKEHLSNAVDWHTTKANGEPVSDWPQKLISWLARQKDKPTIGQGADTYDFITDDEVVA